MSATADLSFGHPGALRLLAGTLAEAIRPKPPISFRDWLPANINLIDGPMRGEA